MTASDDEPAGFLSRWSRRKALVRQGAALPEPAAPPAVPAPPVATPAATPLAATPPEDAPSAPSAPAAAPPPTLADVARLGRDSDYGRFVAPGVDSGVKNAALKKLFADPHFNVMDGLDIYIDDYGQPDPLPVGMLRQMAQSKALGLFDDETDKTTDDRTDGEKRAADAATTQPVAAEPIPVAAAATPDSPLDPDTDEDADLRLQPHDAAGPTGPGAGAGPDTGRQP
jgi:hypothetical protein